VEAERIGGYGAKGQWWWSLPATAAAKDATSLRMPVAAFDETLGNSQSMPKDATQKKVAAFEPGPPATAEPQDATDALPECLAELQQPDGSDPIGSYDEEVDDVGVV
jgi:hypothetical protein